MSTERIALPRIVRGRGGWVFAGIVVVGVLVAVATTQFFTRTDETSSGPAGAADRVEISSANGLYRVGIERDLTSVPVNELHTWTLRVVDDNGRPVEDASIAVDADMPAHGHGLPTSPIVSESDIAGTYEAEGMKFQMPGDWFVEFTIASDRGSDRARFDFTIE